MKGIPSENFLFLLAYALDLEDNTYLENNVNPERIEGMDFYELLSFVLIKLTRKLLKKGLYKSFKTHSGEIKRVRGKVLFQSIIKSGGIRKSTIECEFDELTFNVLENKILLKTLRDVRSKMSKTNPSFSKDRKEQRSRITTEASKLHRLISAEVNEINIRPELFTRITYNKANKEYRPIIKICKWIYEMEGWSQVGEEKGLKIDREMNMIFESFLRNYLSEKMTNYKVKATAERKWTTKIEGLGNYIPSIKPDIVIFKDNKPVYLLDAKFYKKGAVKNNNYNTREGEENFKTLSHNLYQLISYLSFYNCDGLLVYAQAREDNFEQIAKISPKYYLPGREPSNKFGFKTINLGGDIKSLKSRLSNFSDSIKEKIKLSRRERVRINT